MEFLEIVASSMEEALDKASRELGVDPSRVRLTVIEQAKGLFGQGKLRAKAEVIPEEPVKAEAPAPEPEPEPEPQPEPEPEEAPAPKAPRSRKAPKAVEEEAVEEVAPEAEVEEAAAPHIATQEDADRLIDILDQILDAGELNATAKCTGFNGKYVNLSIDGRDVSYLVGRRGEVLNALQYLMNVIAARQIEGGPRVVLDGNNYRERREEVLTKLALDIAAQVKERGEEAVLDALPAFERRIVHRALVDAEGVTTYSEGEEPNRRVVIAPAE